MDGVSSNRGLDWQAQALCAGTDDPDLFFPDRSDLPAGALAICQGCPVQRECLQHALAQPERFGVWGGRTEREREELLRAGPVRRPVQRPSSWVGLARRRIGA